MLQNMRPEALKKLLASPTLHNIALNEQVRRDAAAASHLVAEHNARKLQRALAKEKQAQGFHSAVEAQ